MKGSKQNTRNTGLDLGSTAKVIKRVRDFLQTGLMWHWTSPCVPQDTRMSPYKSRKEGEISSLQLQQKAFQDGKKEGFLSLI